MKCLECKNELKPNEYLICTKCVKEKHPNSRLHLLDSYKYTKDDNYGC